MLNKALKIIMAAFATVIGLYPLLYFIKDRKFSLLQTKTDALLADAIWNIGFYAHILPSGLALLIGWIQFSRSFRTRRPAVHRTIGKVYVAAALTGALAGIYISLYATGGGITSAGFLLLGIFWFYVTYRAYRSIRHGNVELHQRLMIYSYAACLGAVTLRIYLPLLRKVMPFATAYPIVAWLSWVPNLMVAWIIIQRIKAGRKIRPAMLSTH